MEGLTCGHHINQECPRYECIGEVFGDLFSKNHKLVILVCHFVSISDREYYRTIGPKEGKKS
jgi:hypothetical protein